MTESLPSYPDKWPNHMVNTRTCLTQWQFGWLFWITVYTRLSKKQVSFRDPNLDLKIFPQKYVIRDISCSIPLFNLYHFIQSLLNVLKKQWNTSSAKRPVLHQENRKRGLRIEDWGLRIDVWGLTYEDWGLRYEVWGKMIFYLFFLFFFWILVSGHFSPQSSYLKIDLKRDLWSSISGHIRNIYPKNGGDLAQLGGYLGWRGVLESGGC